MDDVDEYRLMAEDCLQFAQGAADEDERIALLKIAKTLRRLIDDKVKTLN